MVLEHAKSGQVITLHSPATTRKSFSAIALAKTEQIELIRLVLPAGKELAEHHVKGPITVQCLEGEIAFDASGGTVQLTAGQMLYLDGGVPHALRAVDDAVALVTIVLQH